MAAEEYGLERPTKSYPKRKLLPQFDDEALEPRPPRVTLLSERTDHHVAGTERQLKPNTRLHHPTVKVERHQLQDTLMTYGRTWLIEPDIPDQSMDQGGAPQREKKAIRPGATSTTSPRPKTAYGLHPNCVVMFPDTKAPHTHYASPMR